MTETPTTTSPAKPPRFVQFSRPGAAMLGHPFPARLEDVAPAKQRKDHAALADRVEQASRQIAQLRQAIDRAPADDRKAAAQAALRGDDVPARSEPRLRAELDEATRVKAALEDALRQSADQLLAAVAPKAGEVAAQIERELDEGIEAVRARIADLRAALAELGDLTAQAAWARSVVHAQGQTVSPYRKTAGFADTAGKVLLVEQALDYELGNLAERRRSAEAWQAEQDQFAAGEQGRRDAKDGDRQAAGEVRP